MTPALSRISATTHLAPELAASITERCMRALSFLQEHGCEVELSHDLRDLADFWAENAGKDKLFMVPNFDHRFWPNCGEEDTLLVFVRRGGKHVGVYGHRLMELYDTRRMHSMTLQKSMKTLRYFYQEPEHMAPANETCDCHADIAKMIMYGPICIAGALWLEPELRGNDFFRSALATLARTLALLARSWRWSWMVGVFLERNRILAIDHFAFQNYHPNALSYRGQSWWLCTSTRADAIRIAIHPV